MIWVGRLLTVPLGLVLFVLVLLAVVVLQFSGTFLDPGYYTKELRDADIYEFALVDLATSILDEARELESDDLTRFDADENPLVTLGLPTEGIVASLNRAVPPDWVQSIVEEILEGLGGYLAAERDEFSVTVRAGEQVPTLVSEIKSLLRRADSYNLIFEELVIPRVEDALENSAELPLGVELSNAELVSAARKVVTPEWVQANVEAALDELTPYVVGDREGFEVRVELADRLEIALREIKRLLREGDAYDILYDEVIEPAIRDSLGDAINLPVGVAITDEDVTSALRQVAPPDWVQEQAERVIDEAGPYLAGEVDSFRISIPLAQNKRDARRVIAETVGAKLEQAAESLPVCTATQAGALLTSLTAGTLTRIPNCVPPGIPLDTVLAEVEKTAIEGVDSLVLGQVPDLVLFTDSNLREALRLAGAEDNIELIDEVRKIVGDGWSYTDSDLRRDVASEFGEDELDALDDVLEFLADGWTYTQVDFREDIGDEDNLKDFDGYRDRLDLARTLRLLIYLPVLLVLVAIGFLGGRGWSGRIRWAAGSLAVASALIFVAAGPVYGSIGDGYLDDLKDEIRAEIDLSEHFPASETLLIEKAFEVAESAIDGVASGVAYKALLLLVVGLVIAAVPTVWGRMRPKDSEPESP